jgi:hypothetical protein
LDSEIASGDIRGELCSQPSGQNALILAIGFILSLWFLIPRKWLISTLNAIIRGIQTLLGSNKDQEE